MDQKLIEEYLEFIWVQREDGRRTLTEVVKILPQNLSKDDFGYLKAEGYLSIKGNEISLTDKGERLARTIIRGHRLAERLFTDVLELNIKLIETNACSFEHIVHDEVAQGICTLLGHPKECPHGKPIPLGDCCLKAKKETARLILPLSEMPFGQEAKVAYITTQHLNRLNRLSSLGIVPGVIVSLHQKFPTPILNIEHTQIAIEEEILGDIYVRKTS